LHICIVLPSKKQQTGSYLKSQIVHSWVTFNVGERIIEFSTVVVYVDASDIH